MSIDPAQLVSRLHNRYDDKAPRDALAWLIAHSANIRSVGLTETKGACQEEAKELGVQVPGAAPTHQSDDFIPFECPACGATGSIATRDIPAETVASDAWNTVKEQPDGCRAAFESEMRARHGYYVGKGEYGGTWREPSNDVWIGWQAAWNVRKPERGAQQPVEDEVDYREALRRIANGDEDPSEIAHLALHHGTPLKREAIDLDIAAAAMLRKNHPKMEPCNNRLQDTYVEQAQVCAETWGLQWRRGSDA